jgi:hypothetical protein
MRRIPYCPGTAATGNTASGSAPNGKDMDRTRGAWIIRNGGGRPPFLRIQRNDRLPLSREAIVFFEYDER